MIRQKLLTLNFVAQFVLLGVVGIPTFASSPELPRVYVDSSYTPPSGGTLHTVRAGDNLQAVINVAKRGDIIELEAGAVFTGNFVLPRKDGTGWIYIRSSRMTSLPAEGKRVKPTDAANMPRIQSSNSLPAIRSEFGAGYYRLVGIEIASSFAGTTNNLVFLGWEDRYPNIDSEFAEYMIFDRCYLHGEDNQSVVRAINGCGKHIAVVDSWISKIHVVGRDSQAFNAIQGVGPYKIVNNYLEAAAENIMFGGAGPDGTLRQPNPEDIEIRRNYIYKPLSWRADHPEFAGTTWTVKNLLELKMGNRVLIEGNILENCWMQAQRGAAFVFTPRENVVQNVTVRNNIVRAVAVGATMSPANFQLSDLLWENNLFYDFIVQMVPDLWGPGSSGLAPTHGLNIFHSGGRSVDNLLIRNNTLIGMANQFIMLGDHQYCASNITVYDNISSRGVWGSGRSAGLDAIRHYLRRYEFDTNVLIGVNAAAYVGDSDVRNTFTPGDKTEIDFTGSTLSRVEDFRLLSSSPYRGAGRDGKDLGVDIDQLLAATSCTISGACGISTVAPVAPTRLRRVQ